MNETILKKINQQANKWSFCDDDSQINVNEIYSVFGRVNGHAKHIR